MKSFGFMILSFVCAAVALVTGVYILRMTAGASVATQKLVLLK